MKDYTFAYGSGTVALPLDETQVIGVVTGHQVPAIGDIGAALRESVEAPIDHEPLRDWVKPGHRVLLIISDMSRFWMRQDLVIPHVTDYLTGTCGVKPEELIILVATGTHIGGDEKELRTLVTDRVYDSYRVVNHDCLRDEMVDYGTTSRGTPVRVNALTAWADRIVCLGAATHHVMAGYGGGRKSILPGVSSMETICANHAHCLAPTGLRSNPAIGNGITHGNPMNEDLCEAASMVPNLFMINLVMNADQKLARILSGHWLTSWEKACETVNGFYTVDVPEKADVVIASCGGFPKDMSLYQGTKTIDNVESGLKPGGTLILIIEARDGGGPEEYFGWIDSFVDGTMEKKLREHFTVPGYIFLLNCEQAMHYRLMMLTSVKQETVAPMGIEAYQDVDSLLKAAQLEGKRIYVIPNGATVIPHPPEEA